MENENSLATEILHDLKQQSRRYFILSVILIVLIVLTNTVWGIAWSKHVSNANAYNLNGSNHSTVLYNNEGDVKINGENTSK